MLHPSGDRRRTVKHSHGLRSHVESPGGVIYVAGRATVRLLRSYVTRKGYFATRKANIRFW